MKTYTFENREDWLEARKGKITGSTAGGISAKARGEGLKKGVYELIAARIAIEEDGDEKAMDRGTRLESEAIQFFMDETGKKVDTSLVIWCREDNEDIAISPDGFIGKKEAIEVKCLSSASHIEAWHTGKIPKEYEDQALQYFVVNEKLITLWFCFYDPRIPAKPFFYHEITRESMDGAIEVTLDHERHVLAMVEQLVTELTF